MKTMTKPLFYLVLATICTLATACQKNNVQADNQTNDSQDYTRFVNPFIGTDGTGHTFPGAAAPFGMVQPSPDNRDNGWDYTSGYQYRDSVIIGFSQTHLSGTGIGELGDVLLQPFVGNVAENYGIGYTKNSETAHPAYYAVTLNNQIRVELTATSNVAFHRYGFPKGANASVLLDLQHGIRFLNNYKLFKTAT
jgi:putative alpha-1,2-mannosidase